MDLGLRRLDISMMVSLFRADPNGICHFYTVHDLQRSLLDSVVITVITSRGDRPGKETVRFFDTEKDAGKWLSATLARKRRSGFKSLYFFTDSRPAYAALQRLMTKPA